MKDAELDLGIVTDKTDKSYMTCCDSGGDELRYPELCFRGKHADLFRQKYGQCAPGDEYEATFRLRVKVSGDSDSETDDYNKRIEFAVTAIIGDVVEESPSDNTPDNSKDKSEVAGPTRRAMPAKKPAKAESAY